MNRQGARTETFFSLPAGPSKTKFTYGFLLAARQSVRARFALADSVDLPARREHAAPRGSAVPSNPARHALGAIQLFCSWQNSMNRQGARLTECWGQIPPARDCWSRKSIKQPKVVWSISASARTEAVFSPGRPIRRPMGAPPRRPHRGFCWGFLGLSRGPARSPVLACCRAAPRALP